MCNKTKLQKKKKKKKWIFTSHFRERHSVCTVSLINNIINNSLSYRDTYGYICITVIKR